MYNLQHPSGWFCSMTPQIYFVLKSELKPGWLSLHLPHYICHVCLHFVTCLSYQIFNMILVYFMSYVQKQHNKYDISYMTFAIYYLWKESFKYDITLLPTLSRPPPWWDIIFERSQSFYLLARWNILITWHIFSSY